MTGRLPGRQPYPALVTEQAPPNSPGRRVAWISVTTGVLAVVGVLVADALSAPGWLKFQVILGCVLVAAPTAQRMQTWVDNR